MYRRILGLAFAIGMMASMSEAAVVVSNEFNTHVRFDEVVEQVDIGIVTAPRRFRSSFDHPDLDGAFDHQITFAWPETVPLHGTFYVSTLTNAPGQFFVADFSATLLDATGTVLAEAVLRSSVRNFQDKFILNFADVVAFETYTLVMQGLGDGRGVSYSAWVVPVPPAMLLFATALGGLFVAHRRPRRRT